MNADVSAAPLQSLAVAHSMDQRLSARLACGPEITCRLLGRGMLDCHALRVQNLSTGGISILLDRVVPSGKLLTIQVENRHRGAVRQWTVRVIYTMQLPGGGLMLGAAFCPTLSHDDVAVVL